MLLKSGQLMALKHVSIPLVQCTNLLLRPTGGCDTHNQEEINSPPAVTTTSAKKDAKHEGNMDFPTDIGYMLPTYFS